MTDTDTMPTTDAQRDNIADRETWKAKMRANLVKRGKAPCDLLAEHAVLDLAPLVPPEAVATVAVWLHGQAFTSPARSRLWCAVVRMVEAGEPVDLITAAGTDDDARKEAVAILALNCYAMPARFEGFARTVAEWHAFREAATEVSSALDVSGCTPAEAIARLAAANVTLPATSTEAAAQAVSDSHALAQGIVDDYYRGDDDGPRISTTLPDLDRALGGGLHADRPTVLGASTGVGKTAAAIQIACAAARDVPVYVLNAESTRRVWRARAASHVGGLDLGDLLNRRLDDVGTLTDAVEAVDAMQLFLDDGRINDGRPNLDVNAFCERVLTQHRKTPLGLVVVDYITKLTIRERFDRPDLRVGAISDRLAALCKQLGCPVLVLSQLTDLQPGVPPTKQNVSESRKVAHDASAVILLWAPVVERPDEVEFIVDKSGLSARGAVPARFLGRFQRFESRVADWQPQQQQAARGRGRLPRASRGYSAGEQQ